MNRFQAELDASGGTEAKRIITQIQLVVPFRPHKMGVREAETT
jgi:hypothetical protein